MITIISRAAPFPLTSHQRGRNMVRVRRTPHGKSQPGPIVVTLHGGNTQYPVPVVATITRGHGSIPSHKLQAVHAYRKTNGNVTTPKARNLL